MDEDKTNSKAEEPGSSKPENPQASADDSKKATVLKHLDLDYVLVHEIGQLGRFQKINIGLIAIPLIMSAFMTEFVFSAAPVPHRCQIPECGEISKDEVFAPEWILNAVPYDGENPTGFASCSRYKPTGGHGTLESCPASLFTSDVQACQGYVYGRENSVVYDFDLGCEEWLRTLAGTLTHIGTLLVLPITGYISDRFGRRMALVISISFVAIVGVIKAFSVNYAMYLFLQLMHTTLGAGTFSSGYIFATEFVGPKYRVVTGVTCTSMFAVGLVLLGCLAWLIRPWRTLLLVLHIPCFLIITYYCILSESVRWLLSKQKFEQAKKVLKRVAKRNKTKITENSMNALMTPPEPVKVKETISGDPPSVFVGIFRSRVMLRRICTTPIWWITTTFVYYGLSINATTLSDTIHLNFILTCAIEIPGFWTAVVLLDRIGRKPTLSGGFLFSAACNFAFPFISRDMATVRLVVYLLGKFGISLVFAALYLFTSELYPTRYRHTLLAFSSMVGRLGSITAPLTPALMVYWPGIPSMMFGSMAVLSGILILTQPETLGSKMPDTLAEAEAIGSPESKLQKKK